MKQSTKLTPRKPTSREVAEYRKAKLAEVEKDVKDFAAGVVYDAGEYQRGK